MTSTADVTLFAQDTILTAHTPDCLMSAYAAAAENHRDMAAADRAALPWSHQLLLGWAVGYLADGTASCSCPVGHRADAVEDLDRAQRAAYRRGDDTTAQLLQTTRFGLELALGGVHLGDTLTWRAANGHMFEGPVTGFDRDGHPRAAQWNAGHADSCTCGSWEGEDRSLPDW
jgi:hypothetical protein